MIDFVLLARVQFPFRSAGGVRLKRNSIIRVESDREVMAIQDYMRDNRPITPTNHTLYQTEHTVQKPFKEIADRKVCTTHK